MQYKVYIARPKPSSPILEIPMPCCLHLNLLIIRIGVPFKGVYRGYYKGSVRYCNIGAFIIRIRFLQRGL